MGFKVDTSFLRYLTMGALGTRQVIAELKAMGFAPIELERYCTSNKIWATKVKRLRLPDLICVKTGLKIEVRAKTKLAIRMSDSPANPDRAWDADADNDDIVAFIACRSAAAGPIPVDRAVYFDIGSLRRSEALSKPGVPKSAAEGAERDRIWPATVPANSGTVLALTADRLTVLIDGSGRRQTYRIEGRHAYVKVGDHFDADTTFLAGAPERMADLRPFLKRRYDPLTALQSNRPTDRYAAAKALRFRTDLHKSGAPLLEAALAQESEPRVALEMAGTAMALGVKAGADRVAAFVRGNEPELGMEAILILIEIGGTPAQALLEQIAAGPALRGDERRQAAVWGLGKAGARAYATLVPYLADDDENVAFHAIAAFGTDCPPAVIIQLVGLIEQADPRLAPAASEALRMIGSAAVVDALVDAIARSASARPWSIATLGRLDPDLVRTRLAGSPLLAEIEPLLLMATGANWLTGEEAASDFAFLSKQTL